MAVESVLLGFCLGVKIFSVGYLQTACVHLTTVLYPFALCWFTPIQEHLWWKLSWFFQMLTQAFVLTHGWALSYFSCCWVQDSEKCNPRKEGFILTCDLWKYSAWQSHSANRCGSDSSQTTGDAGTQMPSSCYPYPSRAFPPLLFTGNTVSTLIHSAQGDCKAN